MAGNFVTGTAAPTSMSEFNAKVARLLEGRAEMAKPESTRRNASRKPVRPTRPEPEETPATTVDTPEDAQEEA